MIDASNMTHEEYYRVHGNLSPARTEEALDALLGMESMQGTLAYVTDASAGYIAEDFLSPQIKALQAFAKTLRGSNKQELFNIIARIEDAVSEEVRSAEYGAECLHKIKLALS